MVDNKDGWGGGIFLFLMYPVLKLEICPVACKRKQIIFKRTRTLQESDTKGEYCCMEGKGSPSKETFLFT